MLGINVRNISSDENVQGFQKTLEKNRQNKGSCSAPQATLLSLVMSTNREATRGILTTPQPLKVETKHFEEKFTLIQRT